LLHQHKRRLRGEVFTPGDGNCFYWAIADQLVLQSSAVQFNEEDCAKFLSLGLRMPVNGIIPLSLWNYNQRVRRVAEEAVRRNVAGRIMSNPVLRELINADPRGNRAEDHGRDGVFADGECVAAAAYFYQRNIVCLDCSSNVGHQVIDVTRHTPLQGSAGAREADRFDPLWVCKWREHYGSCPNE
jgi:hypothetical protein